MSEDAPKPKIKLSLANLKSETPKTPSVQPPPIDNSSEKVVPNLTLKPKIISQPAAPESKETASAPAPQAVAKPKITLKLNKIPESKISELEAEVKKTIEGVGQTLNKTESPAVAELKINDNSIDETQKIMGSPSSELLNLNSLNINLKGNNKAKEDEPPLVFNLEEEDPLNSINPRNNSLDPLRLKSMGSSNKSAPETAEETSLNLQSSTVPSLDSLFTGEQIEEQKQISLADAFTSTAFPEKKSGKRTTLILLCVTLLIVIVLIYFVYITLNNIAS